MHLADLQRLLDYDPETGDFRWRVNCGRGRPGDLAGSIRHNAGIVIRIDGKQYPAHRLAWFYVTGTWPETFLRFRNGDRTDCRFANLILQGDVPAQRSAVYARRHRARLRHARELFPDYESHVPGVRYDHTAKKWGCYDPTPDSSGHYTFYGYQPTRQMAEEWQVTHDAVCTYLRRNPPPIPTKEEQAIHAGDRHAPTLPEMRALFHYDPDRGHLYHRRPTDRRFGLQADRANTAGSIVVSAGPRQYPAAMLAWFLTHKVWPPRKAIVFRNGNKQDLRLSNLTLRTNT